MPIGYVSGVHPNERGQVAEARRRINHAVTFRMGVDSKGMETYFPEDFDSESFNGDVILKIFSKSFSDMVESKKKEIADDVNSILKELFPSNKHVKRRLWETFFVSASSYGLR